MCLYVCLFVSLCFVVFEHMLIVGCPQIVWEKWLAFLFLFSFSIAPLYPLHASIHDHVRVQFFNNDVSTLGYLSVRCVCVFDVIVCVVWWQIDVFVSTLLFSILCFMLLFGQA